MIRDPFAKARENKLFVASFLSEISTGKPNRYRVVPSRFIAYLYNAWVDQRVVGESRKMNQQRMTFVLRLLGYTVSRKTRAAISCLDIDLIPSPKSPSPDIIGKLGAESTALFVFPNTSDLPPGIYNELTAVRHTVEILARSARENEDMWGEEGKRPSNELLMPSVKLDPSEVQADAGEPDFEQVEANDAKADAESLTETNDYDA